LKSSFDLESNSLPAKVPFVVYGRRDVVLQRELHHNRNERALPLTSRNLRLLFVVVRSLTIW
jgi:hypothetical protein